MTLAEGLSFQEELTLMETQLTQLKKEKDEREQKRIKEHYSIEAERLNMGDFIITRILNNDAETR